MENRIEHRSLFWPLLLIGIGIVWLLSNLGVLSLAGLSVLFRLWPLLLIIIGLDLLFGRRSPRIGALLGIGTVVLIVVLMLVGPALGWASNVEAKTAAYSEPLEGADSAQVTLAPGVGSVKITPLSDSANLFEADVTYVGDVTYTADGSTARRVNLSQQGSVDLGFEGLAFLFNPEQQLEWNVSLNPAVPLDLTVNAGTGSLDLDLSDFAQLTGLDVEAGTGAINVTLPATESAYRASVTTGTGGGDIRIEDGAAVELVAGSGTGGFTIDVPDNAAVQVVASTGTGSIHVPGWLERISGSDDEQLTGDAGTWQSASFNASAPAIIIRYEGGTGSLTIQ